MPLVVRGDRRARIGIVPWRRGTRTSEPTAWACRAPVSRSAARDRRKMPNGQALSADCRLSRIEGLAIELRREYRCSPAGALTRQPAHRRRSRLPP